ncbi:NADPH-dependent FMN reductase [Bacillus sp. UNC438CL73TsuS30]|uniref:NADPH-dependent FMN reductase n=1 Tax=Bacillus sp. UNC438CL73TsuS30 TaxID=1340434 RepID=UPI0005583AEA|nr:NADPH-dependent FMN reductase [Bacillus sp. UNC438CL73TsuS30]
MSNITIISGSPSEKTRLNGVFQEVLTYFQASGYTPEIINVRELPPEALIHAKFNGEEILDANKKVEDSNIIVILTPVYKASFSGVLKTYMDLLPQNSLEDKTILPIAVGGTFGHLLMIDYALKPVLTTLGATHILKGVYVLDNQVKKISDNRYELDSEAKNRINTSLNSLNFNNPSLFTIGNDITI